MGDPSFQEHDFEPGIAQNGLFWTIPITKHAIDAHGDGKARLRAQDAEVTDYHDIVNAIFGGGPDPLPSHVSFDVCWSGHGQGCDLRLRQ